MITTNYILDETFTLVRQRCGVKVLNIFRELLARSSEIIALERVLIKDEEAAWEWMIKDWSKLSYTDCISFAVMKRLEVREVVTFDVHFSRAGFIML